jgi:hypothetical protein
MFDTAWPDILVGEIDDCQREESIVIFRRMAAIAALLWHRTSEAEDAPSADPGYALITGPEPGGPCAEPEPRRHSRRREKSAHTALARRKLNALRTPNAETRRINRGRYLEVDLRMWRNNMRKTLLVLKGGHPSTGPWCTWVNEPLEDVNISADWVPPPPPPRIAGGDKPPF